jgi:hypothetical protein
MPMNRILEFSPSSEEAVVSRILVLVHQTVDDHFPSAVEATRQFTKTVFSEEGENTAISHVPGASQFAHIEDTSPDGIGSEGREKSQPNHSLPPPPRREARPRKESPSNLQSPISPPKSPPPASASGAPFTDMQSLHASQMTGMGGKVGGEGGPDWATRITVAMLIAGLVMLAYVLLTPA